MKHEQPSRAKRFRCGAFALLLPMLGGGCASEQPLLLYAWAPFATAPAPAAATAAPPPRPVTSDSSARKETALTGSSAVPALFRAPVLPPPPLDRFEQRLLDRHNGERRRLGLPLLLWNSRLAEDAARWGATLAATGAFDHATPGLPDSRNPYADAGENLWAGTRGAFSPEEMVDGWISERLHFRPGRFPQVAAVRNWEEIGHYTQLIWTATREVGCALARGGREDVLVCRYHPAGNIEGVYVGPVTRTTANFTNL